MLQARDNQVDVSDISLFQHFNAPQSAHHAMLSALRLPAEGMGFNRRRALCLFTKMRGKEGGRDSIFSPCHPISLSPFQIFHHALCSMRSLIKEGGFQDE